MKKKSAAKKAKVSRAKTKIHWLQICLEHESIEPSALLDEMNKYQKQRPLFVYVQDEYDDLFLVLASGDTSVASIKKQLNKME